MKKTEILKAMLDARRAAQANQWDRAIQLTYVAVGGLEERRRVEQIKQAPKQVRLRQNAGGGFDVTMGASKWWFQDSDAALGKVEELILFDGGILAR